MEILKEKKLSLSKTPFFQFFPYLVQRVQSVVPPRGVGSLLLLMMKLLEALLLELLLLLVELEIKGVSSSSTSSSADARR